MYSDTLHLPPLIRCSAIADGIVRQKSLLMVLHRVLCVPYWNKSETTDYQIHRYMMLWAREEFIALSITSFHPYQPHTRKLDSSSSRWSSSEHELTICTCLTTVSSPVLSRNVYIQDLARLQHVLWESTKSIFSIPWSMMIPELKYVHCFTAKSGDWCYDTSKVQNCNFMVILALQALIAYSSCDFAASRPDTTRHCCFSGRVQKNGLIASIRATVFASANMW